MDTWPQLNVKGETCLSLDLYDLIHVFLIKLPFKVQLRKLSENEKQGRKDPWTSQFCRARETKT